MERPDHNVLLPTTSVRTMPKPVAIYPVPVQRAWWERIYPRRIALFMASLFLFILAITFMKEGARAIAPLLRGGLAVDSAPNCLGFGSLFAYVVMSGSPVAATALAFFDAGVVDKIGAFAMIAGSRLGASFIVLFIGFLYVLRGRDRATSLGMGVLSLTVTGTTYLPGLLLGTGILATGALDGVQIASGTLLRSFVDSLVAPFVYLVVSAVPDWGVFLLGLGVVLLSFNLFDRCLPEMTLKEEKLHRLSLLTHRPWVMFVLGALVTLFSMSVSLSLSILVPLSNRGLIRRDSVIPYIMGANITTFIDTLFAAVLLNNAAAFTVVLVEMLSITVVSLAILLTFYRHYERTILRFVGWVTGNRRNLAFFTIMVFIVPIVLMGS